MPLILSRHDCRTTEGVRLGIDRLSITGAGKEEGSRYRVVDGVNPVHPDEPARDSLQCSNKMCHEGQ